MTHPTITKELAVQLAREAGFSVDSTLPAAWFASMERFANSSYKLGRNSGLQEARQVALIHSQYPITTDYDRGYDKARKSCANAIQSLKDNTP